MKRWLKVFAVCVCMCAFAAPVSASVVLADWQFNGSLNDSSGNGHHFIQVGDPFGFVSSPSGSAIEMSVDGTQFIYASSDVMGTITTDQTVVFDARVMVTDDTRVSGILQRVRNNNNEVWWRIEADGKQRFWWRFYKDPSNPGAEGAAIDITGSATHLNDGQWHRLTAVKSYDPDDGIVVTLYVDGVFDGRKSDDRWVTDFEYYGGAWMYVGSFAGVDTRDLTGAIDYLTIYRAPEGAVWLPENTGAAHGEMVMPEDVVLSWNPINDGLTIVSQTVLISKDPAMSVIDQTLDGSGNTAAPLPLDHGTAYYWRVDTELSDGTVREGFVWSFVTRMLVDESVILADWQFDNSLADSSGNGHHLTQYGDPFGFVSSPSGSAIERSVDASRYIYTGSDVMETIPYEDTVVFDAVVRVTDDTRVSAILSRERNTNNQVWWRIEADGRQYFYWRFFKDPLDPGYEGAAVLLLGEATHLNDGNWHRLTAVKSYHPIDGIVVTLFANGVFDGRHSIDEWLTDFQYYGGAWMMVGSFSGTDTRDLTGAIDYLTLYHASEGAVWLPEAPIPANGQTVVPTDTVLSWSPVYDGLAIVSQTVFVSTDPTMSVIDQTLDGSGNTAAPLLDKDTTYYWRVDTELSDGTTRTGYVWSFSTPLCLLTAADGDLNGDCLINLEDFAILASNWLTSVYEN